jgi:hypothetical protein
MVSRHARALAHGSNRKTSVTILIITGCRRAWVTLSVLQMCKYNSGHVTADSVTKGMAWHGMQPKASCSER